jgi:hypothetical protein
LIGLLRYSLKVVAPTLLWTALLVAGLVGLFLWRQFQSPDAVDATTGGLVAEQLVPLIAAFFAAGVLDAEIRRGAHELLCSKRQPLWMTVAYRVAVAVVLALLVGLATLLVLHVGIRHQPLGMLLLAATPSAVCMALVSLWTRIRLGNAFVGYVVAVAVWLTTEVLALISQNVGVPVNPLLTLSSYTARLQASAAGAVETTPYVDWWWASKVALLVVSVAIFASITRRVELLIEAD